MVYYHIFHEFDWLIFIFNIRIGLPYISVHSKLVFYLNELLEILILLFERMSSDTYEVTLIREGFEESAGNGHIKRQCNTVLVRGPSGIMLVNPGSPWDGPDLIEALKRHNVTDPSAVKYVVCTDGKASHVGCLSLFSNAEMIIVGHDIQKRGNLFVQHDFMDGSVPFEFDENVCHIHFILMSFLVICYRDPWFNGSASYRFCKGYYYPPYIFRR